MCVWRRRRRRRRRKEKKKGNCVIVCVSVCIHIFDVCRRYLRLLCVWMCTLIHTREQLNTHEHVRTSKDVNGRKKDSKCSKPLSWWLKENKRRKMRMPWSVRDEILQLSLRATMTDKCHVTMSLCVYIGRNEHTYIRTVRSFKAKFNNIDVNLNISGSGS